MRSVFTLLILLFISVSYAQDNVKYQKPAAEILELAEAPLAPSVRMDSKGDAMLFLYRSNFKSIAELSETEVRLGGLRINPKTNIGSRTTYYNDIKVRNGRTGPIQDVKNLPDNPRLSYISFSPDESKVAFAHT
ncbi:MAG: S9 family peptidase, partial [Bacteroidia bacterium]|nr:S9 family peptidase [Bacteroidia bacterium]